MFVSVFHLHFLEASAIKSGPPTPGGARFWPLTSCRLPRTHDTPVHTASAPARAYARPHLFGQLATNKCRCQRNASCILHPPTQPRNSFLLCIASPCHPSTRLTAVNCHSKSQNSFGHLPGRYGTHAISRGSSKLNILLLSPRYTTRNLSTISH